MHKHLLPFVVLGSLIAGSAAYADENPADWRFHQSVDVAQAGLVRTALPFDTLSNAQASLADLRLIDASGQDVSFFVDALTAEPARQAPLAILSTSLQHHQTVLIGAVPEELTRQGVTGLTLYSATDDFLKGVTVEGSSDRAQWTVITKNDPVYKQPGQMSSTRLEWPSRPVHFLRVTLDDATMPPIRVERIDVLSSPKPVSAPQTVQAQILETVNDSHNTQVRLLLPADHLRLDSIQFQVADATFHRPVRIAYDAFLDGQIRESSAAQGLIYRVALGAKSNQSLSVPVQSQIPGRQVVVHFYNGDSRPLQITAVSAVITPSQLVFNAPAAGRYTLWVGNPTAAVKTYDVTQLREPLALLNAQSASIGSVETNPQYQTPGVAPELQAEGSDIDTSSWQYRRKVELTSSAASPINRVELDIPAMTHNANRLDALRIVRDGKQIPYVVDPVVLSKDAPLALTPLPSQPHLSRWSLTLPAASLLVSEIDLTVADPLFRRTVRLYEDTHDDRGELVHQLITQVSWTHTPSMESNRYTLGLNHLMTSTLVTLEVDDGDNPPLHFSSATMSYPVPRLLFPAQPGAPVYLYYGQSDIAAPDYDLKLIADQLLATPPSDATLGAEEILKAAPWYQVPLPTGAPRWIFWIILGLVVAGLLIVIAKLLPEEPHAS